MMASENASPGPAQPWRLPNFPLVVIRSQLSPSPIDGKSWPDLPDRPANWPPPGWQSDREPVDDSVDATLQWLGSMIEYFSQLHHLNVLSHEPAISLYSHVVDDAHLLKQHFQRVYGWPNAPVHPNVSTIVALRGADEIRKVWDWIEHHALAAKPKDKSLRERDKVIPLLKVTLDPPQVVIDGEPIALDEQQAIYVAAVASAAGKFVSGAEISRNNPIFDGTKVNRVWSGLPERIQKLIQTLPGKGSCLTQGR
jgi:hypothetical protein